MKRYSDLINKELKVNKKKTLLSSLGIMIGILFLTFVIVLFRFNGLRNISSVKAENGQYGVRYEINSDYQKDLDILKNNALINSYGVSQVISTSSITKDKMDIGVKLIGLDKVALDNIFEHGFANLNLKSTTLKSNEVLLPSSAKDLGFKVNESITLGEKNYKIVGFFKATSANKEGYLDAITKLDQINSSNEFFAYVNVKGEGGQLLNNIDEVTKALGKKIENTNNNEQLSVTSNDSDNNVLINRGYLEAVHNVSFGNNFKLLGMNLNELVIILIVAIVTIVINFGFINFSLSSKIKQIGILRCIGATPKQIRNIIYKEVAILGAIAVIPGIVLGYGLVAGLNAVLVNHFGMNSYGVSLGFYLIPTLFVFIISIVSIFIGALRPAVKASKISPIDGIRGGRNSNKNIKKVKSKFVRKIFGVEAELAYRNLRAKSTIFWTSTLLLVISFVTFVCLTANSMGMIKEANTKFKITKEIEIYINNSFKEGESLKIAYNNIFEQNKELQKYLDTKGTKPQMATYTNIKDNLGMIIQSNYKLNPDLINHKDFLNYALQDFENSNGTSDILSTGNIWIYNDEAFNLIKNNIKGDKSLSKFNDGGIILVDSRRVLSTDEGKETNVVTPVFEKVKSGDKLGITFVPTNNKEIDIFETVTKENISKLKEGRTELSFDVLGTISPDEALKSLINVNDTLSIIMSENFFRKHEDEIFGTNSIVSSDAPSSRILFDFKTPEDREANINTIESMFNTKFKGHINNNAEEEADFKETVAMITFGTYSFLAIVMIVLMTIIIISKNLNANVRRKEFGTLLALGMSQKGLRKSILFEAVIQFLIITIIGIPISILGLYIVSMLPKMVMISQLMSAILILIAIVGSGIVIILTTIIPFNKFKSLSMAEMMREDE